MRKDGCLKLSLCQKQKWQEQGGNFQNNKRETGNEGGRKEEKEKENSENHVFQYDETFP